MRRQFLRCFSDLRRLRAAMVLCAAAMSASPAGATPAISMDVASGDVLYQQDATQPWYPASTTKLMTVYVALSAVRDGKISMDTPLVVSARAHRMPPSKMGFAVGTQVTLDNALKMLMVRSANDIAITVAEGVSGSVEAFADDMNRAAAEIGLRESHFVNPNGLPDPNHYSSARDMALIARALYAQFPQDTALFDIGALSLGAEIIPNHNNLLGRYPGVDGMKTGFTCAAGFNVVASAYRDGRRVVVVVFGAPTVATRSQKVVALFDRAFAGIDRPSASVVALASSGSTSPPDMHDQVCRARGNLIAQFNAEVAQLDAPLTAPSGGGALGLGALSPERAMLFNTQNLSSTIPSALTVMSQPQPAFVPVPVHVGAEPGYSGPVAQARADHTPVGSEPQPAAVEAYAATPAPAALAGGALAPDAKALPLRGRHAVRLAHRKRGATLKAAAEAPSTKVLAGADEASGKAAAPKGSAKAKLAAKTHAAKTQGAKSEAAKPRAAKSQATKSQATKAQTAGKHPRAAVAKAPAGKVKSAAGE